MRPGIRKGCPAFCTQEVGAGAPQQRQSRRYGGSLLQGGGLVLKALFAQGELWRAFQVHPDKSGFGQWITL